jgi:hypothetical protein
MNSSLARVWRVAAGAIVFLAAGAGVAQQGFPERPGDWEVTTKYDAALEPLVQHFCLTSETWAKGLTQVPNSCKIQDLSVTSKSIHYILDCDLKTAQMKGSTDIAFDGMEHMTGRSTMATTARGKSASSVVVTDYRWKGAACTDADVNTKKKGGG